MVASAFAFSVMSALVKEAGQRLPSQEIVLGRAIVSLILSYWLVRRIGIEIWGVRRRLLVVRGLLGFVGLSCYYYSVTHLPLAEATVIQYVHPLLTALLAGIFLSERVELKVIAAISMSLVGVTMIARPSVLFGANTVTLDGVAVLVGLLGAVFIAAAYVVVRELTTTEHPLVIVFYFPLITVPATVPMVIGNFVWPTPREWLLLAAVGISTQIGQVLLTRGLRFEQAGRATAIGYLHILFAALWGLCFFEEIPGFWTLSGAALVLISFFVVAARRLSPQPGTR